ncbi:hypothetical protein ACK8OR_10020 [Jannaschia sp. KMU-145]|uniref:hypothetical protein n=1 Tax=Jannaschia halovivens TaxID=3388667 RepID=UPI00396B0DBF
MTPDMTRNAALIVASQARMVELTSRFWSEMALGWRALLPAAPQMNRPAFDPSRAEAGDLDAADAVALRPIDGTLTAADDLAARPDPVALAAKDITPPAG